MQNELETISMIHVMTVVFRRALTRYKHKISKVMTVVTTVIPRRWLAGRSVITTDRT